MQEVSEKKSKIISTLAKNVRFLIARSGLTQKKYAEAFGCTPKSFNGYVNGVAEFPTDIFMQISEREQISPSVLYYSDMTLLETEESEGMVLNDVEEAPEYKRNQTTGTVEQLSASIERLTGMLADCHAERERLRGRVV